MNILFIHSLFTTKLINKSKAMEAAGLGSVDEERQSQRWLKCRGRFEHLIVGIRTILFELEVDLSPGAAYGARFLWWANMTVGEWVGESFSLQAFEFPS